MYYILLCTISLGLGWLAGWSICWWQCNDQWMVVDALDKTSGFCSLFRRGMSLSTHCELAKYTYIYVSPCTYLEVSPPPPPSMPSIGWLDAINVCLVHSSFIEALPRTASVDFGRDIIYWQFTDKLNYCSSPAKVEL